MDSVVNEIKAKISLAKVVSEVVELKPAGENRLKGLCPFHNEKTPSFHVLTDKDRYYCFGCQAAGDVFSFVQQTQEVEFRPALEQLANLAGVKLNASPSPKTKNLAPKTSTTTTTTVPMPPVKVAEKTAPPAWIDDLVTQAHLALVRGEHEAARAALNYFEGRGLSVLVEPLRLGVVDESVKVPQAGRAIDRYRGRVVIPTLEGGRAVWFKARDLRTTDELKAAGVHKYDGPSGTMPAPFNPVGLQRAREAGFLILCEGEIDAVSLLAAYGLEYPVMGLPGGSLPQGWAEKIAVVAAPVYLAMDPDDTGTRHTERLQAALTGLGVRCYCINLTADLNELLITYGEKFTELFNDSVGAATLESTSDLLYIRETWLAELDARAQRPHAVYTTGLEPVDTLLGGGYSEGLHLLGGITGGGKTSFALHVALTNALAERPVVYVSYEQSRLELWARIASRVTSVPYKAIKAGTYDDDGKTLLTSSQLKASAGWGQLVNISKNLRIVEGGDALSRQSSSYTVEALANTATTINEIHGAPPLIIIDYVQRAPVPTELRIRDVRERVGYIAGLLQVYLARDLGCPVLALSSIGRSSYKLQEVNLEQRLAAFKESGELEYTAYTSLLLYGLADDVQETLGFRPGMLDKFRPMTIDIVKNREGNVGQIGAKWFPSRGTWDSAIRLREQR